MDDQQMKSTATKMPTTDAEPSPPAKVLFWVDAEFVTDFHAVVRAKTESGCLLVDRFDLTSAAARERFIERLHDKGLRVASHVMDQQLINLVEQHFNSYTAVDPNEFPLKRFPTSAFSASGPTVRRCSWRATAIEPCRVGLQG